MAKRVSVFTLGGTIASPSSTSGAIPTLSGDDLVVATVGGFLPGDITIDVVEVSTLPSPDIDFEVVGGLADSIRESAGQGVTGVVVTQGTDTIEDVAFTLDLRLRDLSLPIIVTGAMRTPTTPGADGPANLLSSLKAAVSIACRNRGVLVLMNDTVHYARWVRKTHTSAVDAFSSGSRPIAGVIEEGQVRMYATPSHLSRPTGTNGATTLNAKSQVLLVYVSFADGGYWVDAASSERVKGIVVAGTGGGHIPEWLVPQIVQIARDKPVVLSSRVAWGSVLKSTYGTPGGEIRLLQDGLIYGGDLGPLKAQILLNHLIAEIPNGSVEMYRAKFSDYLTQRQDI